MWYDVLAVGVLLFAVIRGATKGIVWQLATIAAVVLCFAFAESLSLAIAPYITVKPPLNRWLAMFGLYVFFSFVSFAVARSLKKWIEKAEFVEYDRHLGSVFGFIKGVLLVLVMTFFGVTLTQQMPQIRIAIFHSQTGKLSAVIMDRLHPVMPKELHDVLEPYIHTLDRPGLDLRHSHHHDGHEDHHGEHSHSGNLLEPIEAPPFPLSPRRGENDPLPYDSVTGRDTDRPLDSDFFDSSYPLPVGPTLPDSRPTSPATGTLDDREKLRTERERMLREVADVLADKLSARQAIVSEIENSLAGLPDEIKFWVVKDWYTDYLIFDPKADPDPQTDLSTPFDVRILRQLQFHNVPLSSLSTALQDRLQKTRR